MPEIESGPNRSKRLMQTFTPHGNISKAIPTGVGPILNVPETLVLPLHQGIKNGETRMGFEPT